ncbi:ABC transporter permease [Sphingomonas sp.]|uniref:ABC transporter permease n=1 Tax=Sphingomonas sp. TaxID=28214 RepID=UPI0035BC662D
MTRTRRMIRQTLTIARRDFVATVFTPIFLLFLFAPVLLGSFSTIGALAASNVGGTGDNSRMVAIVPAELAKPMTEADARLRGVFRRDETPPALTILAPARDPGRQARAAFAAKNYDASAVLYGPPDRPAILYAPRGPRSADYLAVLARETLADARLGAAKPTVVATRTAFDAKRPPRADRGGSGFLAVFGIFFLTLFLSGQVVGTMAEERNNKVIEVLAAAVPLEAVFLGKLLGMFGVAILFVAFWGTVVGNIGALMPPTMTAALGGLSPPVGGPMFALLFVSYFTMAYLLLGSVFLGIGAQASTPREIQMLSLPITILQMVMFGLASAAASRPGSWIAMVAEVFPLSSPFAMAGRAASLPGLWPHAAALAWQALWVAIFVGVGARLFRRGVLQSGSARLFWRRRNTVDTGVS